MNTLTLDQRKIVTSTMKEKNFATWNEFLDFAADIVKEDLLRFQQSVNEENQLALMINKRIQNQNQKQ